MAAAAREEAARQEAVRLLDLAAAKVQNAQLLLQQKIVDFILLRSEHAIEFSDRSTVYRLGLETLGPVLFGGNVMQRRKIGKGKL